MLSIRPDARTGSKGESQFYDPGRDLAYISPGIIGIALEQLQSPTSEVSQWLIGDKNPAEIVPAATAVVACINGVSERDFVKLLQTSGIMSADPESVRYIGALVLISVLSWYHRGWAQINIKGSEAPPGLEEYLKAVRAKLDLIPPPVSFWSHPVRWFRHWLKKRLASSGVE